MAKNSELQKYFPDDSQVIFTSNAEQANTKLLYKLVVASEKMADRLGYLEGILHTTLLKNEKLIASNEYYSKRNREQNAIIKSLENNSKNN